MAYFRDFTVCHYDSQSDWRCRLMAIGWIERGKPFDRGSVPAAVLDTIAALRAQFGASFPHLTCRGWHCCSLCGSFDTPHPLAQSHINLYIPHRGFMFLAPGRVDHYIAEHDYAPPDSFVDALLACPPPASAEYRALCRAANRGEDAPLFSV